MCGIAGFISSDKSPALVCEYPELIARIRHRGPDDEGIFFSEDKRALLASVRLRIIDPSSANHQPYVLDNLAVVFNGEIYNYRLLKEALVKEGVIFDTSGDLELITKGFETWGSEFFKKIKGMYAIAIYDKSQHRLYLARDFFGIKPLYFLSSDRVIRFASELKALRRYLKFNLNRESLADFLTFGYPQAAGSLYEDVKQVPPGFVIQFDIFNGVVRQSSFEAKNVLKVADRFGPPSLKQTLESSVGDHLLADCRVATSLSGGLDSSAITALAFRQDDRVMAYTSTFNTLEKDDSEVYYSKILCRKLGIRHRVVRISVLDLESLLREMIWHLEEPIPNPAHFSSFFMGKALARDDIKVTLVGEGADELFGGYPWHRFAVDGYSQNPEKLFDRFEKRRSMFKHSWKLLRSSFYAFVERARSAQRDFFLDHFSRSRGTLLNSFLTYDMMFQLRFNQLHRVDRMFMASGVEARVPFLYDEVLSASYQLPDIERIAPKDWFTYFRIRENKIALAQSVRSLLPRAILKREKFGPRGTINLFKTNAFEQMDEVFSKVLRGEAYRESRKVLSDVLDWKKIEEEAVHPKLQFLIAFLCLSVNQYVLGEKPTMGPKAFCFEIEETMR